jgi:hypothetical protein
MNLNEATISHIYSMMHGLNPNVDSIGIITAENPWAQKDVSSYENKRRNDKLKGQIVKDKYGYIPIRGKYGNFESPFIIQNISREKLIEYGRTFEQEAVIYGNVSNPEDLRYDFINVDEPANERYRHVYIKYKKDIEPIPSIKKALDDGGYAIINYNLGIVEKDGRRENMDSVLRLTHPYLEQIFREDERRIMDYYSEYRGNRFQIPFFDEMIPHPSKKNEMIPNPKTTIGKKFVKKPHGYVIEDSFNRTYKEIIRNI